MRTQSRFLLSLAMSSIVVATACSGGDDDTTDDVTPNGVKIDSFTASATTVASGATVVLNYKVSNATGVSISASPGGSLLADSTTFENMVTTNAITETTVFTLTAAGTGGPKMSTVTVMVDANAVEVLTFTADPNPAPAFSMVELAWTTAGATSVRLLDQAGAEVPVTGVASGSVMVEVGGDSVTYTLEAKNANNNTDSMTLTVNIAELGTINFFRVSPNVFTGASANVTVVWSATGETFGLTANGTAVSNFPGAATGTITLSVSETTLFELSATGAGFTDTAVQAVAQAVPEIEPNNDSATATPISGGATGEINPMDDVDWYSFNVPAGGNVFAQTSDGMGACALDTVITLFDGAGMELGSNDQGGPGDCSQIEPQFDSYARDLAAGPYFIRVESWEASATGTYALVVVVGEASCGNEILEASTGEQCDDGNMTAGDGCSPTCQVQIAGTVTGIGQDQTFDDAIDPASQLDYFQIDLPSDGFIFAETGSPQIGMCMTGVDTIITLYDSTFTNLGGNDDIDFFGDNLCSRIDPVFDDFAAVAAGTYYVGVRSLGGTTVISDYQLQIRTIAAGCGNRIIEASATPPEQCDDGNTAAGDRCNATCQIETFGSVSPPGGNVEVPASGDRNLIPTFIEVVIGTAGQSITATTTDGAGNCPFPTIMGLFTADYTFLGSTAGNGGCAFIDPVMDTYASDLAAGSYRLAVIAENDADMGMVTLEVTINNPMCGNRIQESLANEQCDDGGTANGDGCNSTCRFEGNIGVEAEPNNDAASANPSMAAINTTRTVVGSIDPAADADWWAITVPANGTVIARTYDTFNMPMADCGLDHDTRIYLVNSNGMDIASNDDAIPTQNYCSLIDGTTTPAAANLAAGTYYIRVEHYDDQATFRNYFMDVRLQ
jgi:cysteine-rich repeat protein